MYRCSCRRLVCNYSYLDLLICGSEVQARASENDWMGQREYPKRRGTRKEESGEEGVSESLLYEWNNPLLPET